MMAAEHYQYPQPFELPSAVTAKGVSFTGHRARVYWLLRLTRERRYQHRVGRHLAPAGTVPVFLFREPWAGGQSGGRRVRELRQYGCEVAITTFEDPDGGETATTLYELVTDPLADETGGRASSSSAAPAAPARTAPRTPPLAGLRVRVHDGPGRPVALPGETVIDLGVRGGPFGAHTATAALYDQQLREAWAAGTFQAALDDVHSLVLTCSTYAPFPALEAITHVLAACGAQVDGIGER